MAEKSISTLLNDILDANPNIGYQDAKDLINDKYQKNLSRSNFDKIKHVRKKKNNKGKKSKNHKPRGSTQRGNANHSSNNASPSHPHAFIDDPDELLYSVAIRELNRSQPDPRWANILIQCREKIGKHKTEVLDQLQKLSTKNLTEMLKRQSGKYSQVEL